jgi:hypothetical protein
VFVGRTLVVVDVAVTFAVADVDELLPPPTMTVRVCVDVDLVDELVALTSPVPVVMPDIVPVAIELPSKLDSDRVGVRSVAGT